MTDFLHSKSDGCGTTTDEFFVFQAVVAGMAWIEHKSREGFATKNVSSPSTMADVPSPMEDDNESREEDDILSREDEEEDDDEFSRHDNHFQSRRHSHSYESSETYESRRRLSLRDVDDSESKHRLDSYEILEQDLADVEEDLYLCEKELKKVKKRNKTLKEDLKAKRRTILELEERYALLKVDLARAQANEDNLKVLSQELVGERDLKILNLSSECAELKGRLKNEMREKRKFSNMVVSFEKVLQRKDSRIVKLVDERDALKQTLKTTKRALKQSEKELQQQQQEPGDGTTEVSRIPKFPPASLLHRLRRYSSKTDLEVTSEEDSDEQTLSTL